ncbi:hypothetical protein [Vibrio aestuarianus]|uniref:Exonuclease SbcC n=1 Tax=Vibrio aestuarianus TaxID=28171 RepID=A0ABM9FLW4_9VIBR|nr:hypothetical protein [Vibrio aestuarianus]MDE1227343.1 hypothetical protein [Vibrio aestuarianus]MDE1255313.1 hypothetical protein [Vibrio aestuarianus]MDE1272543.1 hypothetical protein [Vibrio aestuarianus]MDE1293831.1 hypothetical protein [Vibrio aestuarianus]MDE1308862.1 hypothetical protein [Vibrio aestuarianus]
MSKSKKKYHDAIDAIRDGTYTAEKLLKRKTVKLNYNTVEIEAGVTRGALDKHPDIRDKIDNINTGKEDEQKKLQHKIDKEDKKYNELEVEVNLLSNKVETREQLLKEKEETLKRLQEDEFHLVSALFDSVPFSERDKLFENTEKEESGGKIVRFGQSREK